MSGGRGKLLTLPSWMTPEQAEEYRISNSAMDQAPPSDRDEFRGERNERPLLNDGRSSRRRSKSKSRSRDRRSSRRDRSRSPEKRHRSRSRSRSRREKSPSPAQNRWKSKNRSASKFDVKPEGDVAVLPPIPGMNANPNDPAVSAILKRYVGTQKVVPTPEANQVTMQQTKHARRLYVGGITSDILEDELGNFFSELITRSIDPNGQGHVLQVYINRDKCFAFVELRTIELTTACLGFDGLKFTQRNGSSTTLRIRRPNDFKPELLPASSMNVPRIDLSAFGAVSTTVGDGPLKVFVGGLPHHLTEDNVKELLSAFGPLKSFHLVRDPGSIVSKGYGFCEYLDENTTHIAINGLNGMPIGDKSLTVRFASQTGGMPDNGYNQQTNMYQPPLPQLPPPHIPPQPMNNNNNNHYQYNQQQPPPSISTYPTKVLRLGNMVTKLELEDDQEFVDIIDDVKSECSSFGPVLSVLIPRIKDGYPYQSEGFVFVQFRDIQSAQNAANSLYGRKFADRTVAVDFFDESLFANKILT